MQQREHILCDPLTLRQRMSVRNAQCERVQLKQLFHDEIGGGELTVFRVAHHQRAAALAAQLGGACGHLLIKPHDGVKIGDKLLPGRRELHGTRL